MKEKITSVEFMKQLGKTVKQEFEHHNIQGLNEIISWKENLDFKKTQAPDAQYQKQTAARRPFYNEVNEKIHYLRHYLNIITTQLGLKDALAISRIALCQFGLGLCAEQSHFAHYILQKICLNSGILLDSNILTLTSKKSKGNHAFVIYGPDLTGLTNQFSSLQGLHEATLVYDPTYKIFVNAQEYFRHPYMTEFCEHHFIDTMTARANDNVLSRATRESLDTIEKAVTLTLERIMSGINTTLSQKKADPEIIKILKDFQIEIASRHSIIKLTMPGVPAVTTVSEQISLAATQKSIGTKLFIEDQLEEAIKAYQQALDIYNLPELKGEDPSMVITLYSNIVTSYFRSNNFCAAIANARNALHFFEQYTFDKKINTIMEKIIFHLISALCAEAKGNLKNSGQVYIDKVYAEVSQLMTQYASFIPELTKKRLDVSLSALHSLSEQNLFETANTGEEPVIIHTDKQDKNKTGTSNSEILQTIGTFAKETNEHKTDGLTALKDVTLDNLPSINP